MREHRSHRNYRCWGTGFPASMLRFRHRCHPAGRFPRREGCLAMLERYREELEGLRGELEEKLAWVGREIDAIRRAPMGDTASQGDTHA